MRKLSNVFSGKADERKSASKGYGEEMLAVSR